MASLLLVLPFFFGICICTLVAIALALALALVSVRACVCGCEARCLHSEGLGPRAERAQTLQLVRLSEKCVCVCSKCIRMHGWVIVRIARARVASTA